MNTLQLEHLQRATLDLIASEPTMVGLVKAGFVRTAAGGVVRNPGAAEDPKERFFGSADRATEQRTSAGEMVICHHVLVGPTDDNIEEGDTFSIGARKFEVVFVDPATREFECKGWVIERS